MTIFYRRMPAFDYRRPATLAEALAALAPGVPVRDQVYSGGTDLLAKLKSRAVKAPPAVIDLKGIPGLAKVDFDPVRGLAIGANAAIRDVARHPTVVARYGALAQGAALIASNQLQHRGTIVGNICNAVPSADSAPALLVHDTMVVCVSAAGERVLPIADFFVDAGVTALGAAELVTALRLAVPAAGERSAYLKLAPRGRMDLAVVGVAASLVVEHGVVRRARIALGSAAPVPMRALRAEAALVGRRLDAALIDHVASIAAADARTRSSHRASADYRREMLEVLVARALGQLAPHSLLATAEPSLEGQP